MTQAVKKFIENYISLIDKNMFDEFFERAQEEFIPQTVHDIGRMLEDANIHPLKYMTFIPEGYYMISQMTSFVTPKNIVRVCYKAFSSADIETLHVTSNCIELEPDCFEGCYFLEKVTLDEGVKHIGDSAFYACDELTEMSLPAFLVSIGHNVFCECTKLTEIHYQGTKDQWKNIRNYEFINEGGGYISKIHCSDGTLLL